MSIVFNFTSQYVSYRIAKGVCESARRVNITHKQRTLRLLLEKDQWDFGCVWDSCMMSGKHMALLWPLEIEFGLRTHVWVQN